MACSDTHTHTHTHSKLQFHLCLPRLVLPLHLVQSGPQISRDNLSVSTSHCFQHSIVDEDVLLLYTTSYTHTCTCTHMPILTYTLYLSTITPYLLVCTVRPYMHVHCIHTHMLINSVCIIVMGELVWGMLGVLCYHKDYTNMLCVNANIQTFCLLLHLLCPWHNTHSHNT